MIKINVPKHVNRGNELKGAIEITEDEVKSARNIDVVLYNMLKFDGKKENHSSWEIKRIFSPNDVRKLFELPFEFAIDSFAPITYQGKKLSSKWKLAVRIDVIGGLDKEKKTEIIVLR